MLVDFSLYAILSFIILSLWDWASRRQMEILLSAVRNEDIAIIKYKKFRYSLIIVMSLIIPIIIIRSDSIFIVFLGFISLLYFSLYIAGAEKKSVDTVDVDKNFSNDP